VQGAREVPGAFDVEPFRSAGRRVVLRDVVEAAVVIGSAQPSSVVDADRASRRGVSVVRRRSGGAAVLLQPGAQVWADLWVPRDDPLWALEPRASAAVAGEWWARALGAASLAGAGGLSVHRGGSVPAPGSDVVCFAGVGPGEVVQEGRKVVGLAQWRSREGVLVHGCAYRRWDPEPLIDLLDLPWTTRHALAGSLRTAALGFADIGDASWGHDQLVAALPEPASWEVLQA
jgi:lipoate-protein ligase A